MSELYFVVVDVADPDQPNASNEDLPLYYVAGRATAAWRLWWEWKDRYLVTIRDGRGDEVDPTRGSHLPYKHPPGTYDRKESL